MSSGLKTFHLKYARPDDVLPILRQLLEIPEDKNLAADGSIRVAQEAGSDRLLVSGRPDKVARASEIIEKLDVPTPGSEVAGRLMGSQQLEVYPLNGCDGPSVLAVMQTLLAGQSDVRLSIDPKTSSLIVLARPAQQATIRATLGNCSIEGERVEVIHLTHVDPQSALDSINKLFSSGNPLQPSTTAPQVDADSMNHQLLIRATDAQILEIRDLLTKMGEHLGPGDAGQGGHVRTLQMSEESARTTLQRVEAIWPSMRSNKIRIVSPSTGGGAEPPRDLPHLPSEAKPSTEPNRALPLLDQRPADLPRSPEQMPREPPQATPAARVTMAAPALPGKLFGARIIWVADPAAAKPAQEGKSPAPIIVIPGPNGLTIASEDLAALDEFERLLTTESDETVNGPLTVFYLKNAKAQAVAETLDRLLSGGLSESEISSTRPSSAARLSESRKALATGPVKITPEARLNALIVLANRTDQSTVKQLLEILDRKESPEEIGVSPKPRMIPVEYARAKDIADMLREIYADRLVVAPGQERGRSSGFLSSLLGGMSGGRPVVLAVPRAASAAVAIPAGKAGATTPTESRSASTPVRTP